MQNCHIPSRRRIPHSKTKYTICHSTRIGESNQNLPPLNYRMSDKTALAINKANERFQKELNLNRQYLSEFDARVENVYKKQLFRNYLKERQYNNMLSELQKQNGKYQQEITKMKALNQENYRAIMDQNQRLQNLKRNYQQILSKQTNILQKQKQQYEQLTHRNNQLKQKIKHLWKCIGNFQSRQTNNESKNKNASRRNSKLKQKTILLKNRKRRNTITSVIQQDQSLYITNHMITEQSSEFVQAQKKSIVKQNQIANKSKRRKSNAIVFMRQSQKQVQIQVQPHMERIKTKIDDSGFSHYDSAIKQIQQLEMSIINSKRKNKKDKSQKQAQNFSVRNETARRQKIKDRVQQIQHANEIIKLFIVFLKSNQGTQNKTGLQNLRKIICYFENHLRNKQQILQNVKKMMKNLGI